MSKKRHQKRSVGKSQAQIAGRRAYVHMAILVVLTVGLFASMALLLSHARQTDAQSSSTPLTKEPVAAPEAKWDFDRLKGRWRRPDGGYILEIKEIDPNWKMVAAYCNPRPINVSRAEVSQEGTTNKLFIELRDTNYPGSTYTLTYDPVSDQLTGVYFQAALKQSFDVVFLRMK
jgi:hypothetical protein